MSTLGPVASTATLRAGWRVIGQGIREEKGWVGLAVFGATIYGIMTVGTAWVIGRIVHDTIAPAIGCRPVAVVSKTIPVNDGSTANCGRGAVTTSNADLGIISSRTETSLRTWRVTAQGCT